MIIKSESEYVKVVAHSDKSKENEHQMSPRLHRTFQHLSAAQVFTAHNFIALLISVVFSCSRQLFLLFKKSLINSHESKY